MRYPAYPDYKESGVQWLGPVPGHWEVKGLRYVCRLAYGDSLAAETREDGDIAVFGSNGRVGSHISANTKSPVIVVGRKGSFGKINYSDEPIFAIDTTYFIDGSCTKNALSWLKYSLLPLRLDETSKDSAVPGLAREDAYESRLPVPPLPEQTAIADFLDRKTKRIDTLMTKKRRLIALLKEKRTALISRTVTRGLPESAAREFGLEPHTHFKDSGVEWLGQVPEGWGKARKLTHFAADERNSFVNGPFGSDLLSSEIVEEGVPVIYIRDISSGKYRRKSEGHITEEKATQLKFCNVVPGDILIAKVGDPPGIAVVYPDGEPYAIVTQDVIRLRVDLRKVSPGYLTYFLNSSAGRGLIDQVAIESTRMRVGLGDYKGSLAVFPPLPEQTAIANFLDRETVKIDKLVEKVEAAIARLQEYRTALITAAVTGKIDVRKTQSKEDAA